MANTESLKAMKNTVHSIAESLLEVARIEGVDSINIHASIQHNGSGFISGFAIDGETLLFDFREIVGYDE